jgi:hypothetical protein
MATVVPRFAAPLRSASPKPTKAPRLPAPAPNLPPPWPRDGYSGAADARRLEKAERDFIRELAAPVDLERMLMRATNYEALTTLSARDIEAALNAFVQRRRSYTEERLALFAQAEEAFRAADAQACRMRLDRLRFEIGDYLTRLTAAKTLLVLRLEKQEQQKHERAQAMTEAIVDPYIARAEARAAAPRDDWRPSSIAPWLPR